MGVNQIAVFFVLGACLSPAYAQQPAQTPAAPAATGSGQSAGHAPAATQPSAPRKPHAGYVDEKYDNGNLKSRYTVDAKGVKQGSYSLYSEDGKRSERGVYRNGELEGVRQTFYSNGNVKLQESYRKGQLNGSVIANDENGNPVRAAEFNAGVPVSDRILVNGILVYPRSPQMIVNELDRIHKVKVETVQPTEVVPPHEGGNDSQADREDAVRRLMQYRYLCYVPYEQMKLDPVFCAHDEAAAAILAVIGKLDHTPPNPGWPEDQYKYACKGTSNSNIYQASARGPLCVDAVNDWMDDSDSANIDRIGHRRWCLNPPLAKVGLASFKGYAAMWSMDASRKDVPDFDFVAYPSPGFFPTTYFGSGAAWSVSLNPSRYRKPPSSGLTVTVTPAQVQLEQNKIVPAGKPLEFNYNAVNNVGFGIPNCIIFRPIGLKYDPGSAYLVEVLGLQELNGKPAAVRYIVEFFKPDPAKTESPAPE